MQEIFFDALIDTIKMVPFLLLVYIGIELIEYKLGNLIRKKIGSAGNKGPILGALLGAFPQCGFSVVASVLYTQKLVTIGTFLAVLLSTSDEAIPVILSQPDKVNLILPLILTKVFIALVAGYFVDFIFRKANKKILSHIDAYSHGKDDSHHHHESVREEPACCGHFTSSEAKKFNPREIFLHPLIHTFKIFIFILLATLLINFSIFCIGEENFARLFLTHSFWQPFLAALVGLIPNCAASVVITQMYLDGVISYGSVISGLCASGGLGILVLFKEDTNKKEILKVIGFLFGISVVSGLIIQYIF